MKEHAFPFESFIGGWYMPKKLCDKLILYHKKNKHLIKDGIVGGRINKAIKDSKDITILENEKYPVILDYRNNLQQCLNEYVKKYKFVDHYERFNINSYYYMQHYLPKEGFKKWHFESEGKQVSNRILVFMTYLNNVKDGGTEFYYQKLISPCKKGLTLIWPAGFTHTHKGQISNKKEKYIVTGWYTFN